MKLKRLVVLFGLVCLTGMFISGCASTTESDIDTEQTSNQDGSAEALQKVSFVLDYAPNVNHTGLYVALENGWFAEEGIEVELVPAPADGSDALIGSGGADMGMTYQDYIANSLGSSTPMPYRAVAAVVQHNTSGIMSRSEDGIVRPADMAGKRYATWNLPVEQATIRHLVEADGANFEDVELVPYEVDDDVMGLQADLYDCVWVYEWWAVANAALQDYPVNYFGFADMDDTFDFYTPVIAVNDNFAANNPDTVKAFLRAAKRGYEFAASNPTDAADILCQAVPELDTNLIQKAQETISPLYIADAEQWGFIDQQRWATFYQWLNDEGLVEHSFDPSSGYTLDYLEN